MAIKRLLTIVFLFVSLIGNSQSLNDLTIRNKLTVDGSIEFLDSTITGTSSGFLPDTNKVIQLIGSSSPSAAGVTGNIQVNDDGVLGASENFTWNDTTLNINSGTNNILISGDSYDNIDLSSAIENTFIGKWAGINSKKTQYSTFIGAYSGENDTSGISNTFIGYFSGSENYNGIYNVCLGNYAGSGGNMNYSTVLGHSAGSGADIMDSTVLIGYQSGQQSGSGNIMIGFQSGYSETGSDRLYIENSNSTTPLIYGEFDNNKLVFNVDTATTAGHHKIDSTLEVECSQIVINKLYAHAYLPEDSTGVTSTTTVDTYNFVVGNFINDMLRNVDFDVDTLQVNRPQIDSIYIKVNYTVAVSSNKNSDIKFGFSNNGGVWSGSTKGVSLDLGETESVTHSFNKWVYDNEDIKFIVKSSALNTDISITEANLELIELYTSKNYNK